ncbi:MAG: methyltransferase domain-containing protein [Pseudomonadota bacterium]
MAEDGRASISSRMRSCSLCLFNGIYGEEFWEFNQRRFLPVVRDALAPVSGPVVDAACGAWNYYLAHLDRRETIGIDLDDSVRERNTLHNDFLICDLHEPIALQDIGGVISVNTWEHLQNPNKVLNNFRNILKKDGVLIIVAPQKYYYISLVVLALPNKIKDLAWRLLTRRTHMPFPAYYRLCTRSSLERGARENGFELVAYRSHDVASNWFLVAPPLFLLFCAWMSLINRVESLSPLRSSFVAVLRKTAKLRSTD